MFRLPCSAATAAVRAGRISLFCALLALCAAAGISPARAEFYPASEPGYSLSPLLAGAGLALDPASNAFEALSASAEAQGLLLHGAFRVEAGMSRFFGVNTFAAAEQGSPAALEESQLDPLKPLRLAPLTELPSYRFEGRQVCIGLGQGRVQDAEEYNWNPLLLLSFALPDDGSGAELLAQWELPAQYSEGIYALDMVRDGVVELVVPWATGVAGGGGADVVAVVPTGGLAGFGGPGADPELPEAPGSSFYSTHGSINLLDYNGDGDWELETIWTPFAAVFAYYYPQLYSFDREAWAFAEAQQSMPGYYAAANGYYRELLAKLELALARPAEYYSEMDDWTGGPGYSTQVGGAAATLSPFMSPGADPAHPLLDEYNIEALRSMLAGLEGKGAE
ncbi:hypothetical protein IT575_11435 [bacterium]|nr:hypothetical protein [bacterium]